MRQPGDGALVEGHGVLHEALEVPRRNWTWVGQRTRWRASFGVQSSSPSMTVPLMVMDRPSWLAPRRKSAAASRLSCSLTVLIVRPPTSSRRVALREGRGAVVQLDVGRLRAQGLGVEVIQDEPGFRPEGQAHVHEIVGRGVEQTAGLKLQTDDAILALPEPHGFAGVAVRHEGLAQHGMLVQDGFGFLIRQRHREQPHLNRGKRLRFWWDYLITSGIV